VASNQFGIKPKIDRSPLTTPSPPRCRQLVPRLLKRSHTNERHRTEQGKREGVGKGGMSGGNGYELLELALLVLYFWQHLTPLTFSAVSDSGWNWLHSNLEECGGDKAGVSYLIHLFLTLSLVKKCYG